MHLHKLLLDFGSSTPDNLEAVRNIAYVTDGNTYGVGTESGILASAILNKLEETGIPPELKSDFPHMSIEAWEGTLRYCTLVLCALEGRLEEGPKSL